MEAFARQMHGSDLGSLAAFLGVAISLTTLAFAATSIRALRGAPASEQRSEAQPVVRILVVWVLVAGALGAAVSHSSLAVAGSRFLPLGAFVGIALALVSLAWAPARRAFDQLSDAEVRGLLVYRATFGGMLIAGAALGSFPPVFAWTAGVGDLLVTWLAAAMPGALATGGSRPARLLVHGWGLFDLVQVVVVVLTIVRPWLIESNAAVPSLLLPWIGVPLMLALNLHGFRHALSEARSNRGADAESLGDRPEPAGRVRRAVG